MPRQILLADDSATIARMVQIAFAHEDYQVSVARSADEALARARSHRPDVVLADAGLAGKSGYDLCAELRQIGLRDLPVLILTNNFVPYDEARGQRASADGFVVKPFETQGLIDRVGQMIAQKTAGGGAARAGQAQGSNLGPQVSLPPAAPPRAASAPSHPAVTVPAVQPTPPSTQAVRPAASPLPPAAPPARAPAPAPVAAAPQAQPPAAPRAPDSIANVRTAPRATLMGLPTVGPDGLPIPIGTPPPAPRPAPHAHAPAPVSAAPPAMPSAPVMRAHAPTPAAVPAVAPPAARPQIFSPDEMTRPAVEAVRPPAPAAQPVSAPPPHAAPPMAAAPTAPTVSMPAARPQAPRTAIPANAPKMPRPSLVPNAPPPDALRQMVAAVAGAAHAHIGQALGAHPEYEAIARLSREVIEQIAWEVVPELAEVIIRSQLDRLVKERQQN